MIVGVPKEIKSDEYRVAMLPVGAEELTAAGHTVLIEAGRRAGQRDHRRPVRRRRGDDRRRADADLVAGRPDREGQGAAAESSGRSCGPGRRSSPTSTSPPTRR